MVRSPWQIAASDLAQLRGSGGVPFTEFVDALLRAEAAATGIARPEDVVTNIRVNIADGGVDSEVRIALLGRPGFETPTCWQYKAASFSEVGDAALKKEMAGARAVARIQDGYAYAVCVCDDSPPDKKAEREATLNAEREKINPAAPRARFLGASELAAWANRFPSIVVRFFRPALTSALTYERWREKERGDLPTYVEVVDRKAILEGLSRGVNLRSAGPCVTVLAGPTGAGKTRLALEALAPSAELVLYTIDGDHVVGLVTAMVNDPDAACVLVVDNCSLATIKMLGNLLAGVPGRIRAVAVADSSEESPSASLVLPPLQDAVTAKILEANFPEVGPSHRRAVAELAGGVLRVAATLAREYRVAGTAFLDATIRTEDDTLRLLVRADDDRKVLEAISMFTRVGFAGRVASQLDGAAKLFSLDRGETLRRARRLSSAPGLATVGQRYLAVRPPLYCGVLIATAWKRWVADDAAAFLDRVPVDLKPALLQQLGGHAPSDIRDQVAAWASTWVRSLTPKDLSVAGVVEILLPLVEVHPRRFGTALCGLVREATIDEIRAPAEELRGHQTRLHILWCLERLLSRVELYDQAESALFRLALAESDDEASGTSSATEKWASSFRVFLSGTETPFSTRFGVLERRWAEGDPARARVLGALEGILDPNVWKVEGSPLLGGQLRPIDWQPRRSPGRWGN